MNTTKLSFHIFLCWLLKHNYNSSYAPHHTLGAYCELVYRSTVLFPFKCWYVLWINIPLVSFLFPKCKVLIIIPSLVASCMRFLHYKLNPLNARAKIVEVILLFTLRNKSRKYRRNGQILIQRRRILQILSEICSGVQNFLKFWLRFSILLLRKTELTRLHVCINISTLIYI